MHSHGSCFCLRERKSTKGEGRARDFPLGSFFRLSCFSWAKGGEKGESSSPSEGKKKRLREPITFMIREEKRLLRYSLSYSFGGHNKEKVPRQKSNKSDKSLFLSSLCIEAAAVAWATIPLNEVSFP